MGCSPVFAKKVVEIMNGKRTRGQRERDFEIIERLYLEGHSTRQIAAKISENGEYTLSQAMIVKEIDRVRRRWREELGGELVLLKSAEMARLQRVESESWAEWHRSKLETTKTVEEKRQGEDGGITGSVRREKAGQIGDPKFLDVITKCIMARIKLLGLESVEGGSNKEITVEDIIRTALSPGGYGAVPGSLSPEAYLERKEAERLAAEQGIEPMDESERTLPVDEENELESTDDAAES